MQQTATLSGVLTAGFSKAAGRLGAIIVDLLWKALWLASTVLAFLAVVLWFYRELGAVEISGPVSALNNPLAAMMLARQLWDMYAATLFGIVIALVLVSGLSWMLLESYFRAGLLPSSDQSFARRAREHFVVFLTSAALKLLVIGGTGTTLAVIVFGRYLSAPAAEWRQLWTGSRGPLAVLIVVVAALWFAMTLLETLLRSDSVELLGRHLFLVVGLTATLLGFEGMIVASAALSMLVLNASVTGPGGTLLTIAAMVGAALALNVLHSYLLLVRFHSLAAMRSDLAG